MTTRQFKTYAEDVTVTDRDAVEEIIKHYRFPTDVEVFVAPGTDQLRLNASNRFLEAYTTEEDEPQEVGLTVPHTPALGEFFEKVAKYITPGDSWVIQLVGLAEPDKPFIAVEWIVSNGTVREIAFTNGESTDWTDLTSNDW